MNRREFLIKGIGAAIVAGATPPLLMELLPEKTRELVFDPRRYGKTDYEHVLQAHYYGAEIGRWAGMGEVVITPFDPVPILAESILK